MKRIINVVLIVLSLSVIIYLAQTKMGISKNQGKMESFPKEKFEVTFPGTNSGSVLKTTVDIKKEVVVPSSETNTKKTISPASLPAKSGGPSLTAPIKK